MNIYEIKRRIEANPNSEHPYFFKEATMRFFGQKLKDFKVYKVNDDKYHIVAPHDHGWTERYFIPSKDDLEMVPKEDLLHKK